MSFNVPESVRETLLGSFRLGVPAVVENANWSSDWAVAMSDPTSDTAIFVPGSKKALSDKNSPSPEETFAKAMETYALLDEGMKRAFRFCRAGISAAQANPIATSIRSSLELRGHVYAAEEPSHFKPDILKKAVRPVEIANVLGGKDEDVAFTLGKAEGRAKEATVQYMGDKLSQYRPTSIVLVEKAFAAKALGKNISAIKNNSAFFLKTSTDDILNNRAVWLPLVLGTL